MSFGSKLVIKESSEVPELSRCHRGKNSEQGDDYTSCSGIDSQGLTHDAALTLVDPEATFNEPVIEFGHDEEI